MNYITFQNPEGELEVKYGVFEDSKVGKLFAEEAMNKQYARKANLKIVRVEIKKIN